MMRRRGRYEAAPWWQREAVRIRGYTVCTAVVGILVLREWVTNEEAGYLLMALAAVLGVYGIESSRDKTTTDRVVEEEVIPEVVSREAGQIRRVDDELQDREQADQ